MMLILKKKSGYLLDINNLYDYQTFKSNLTSSENDIRLSTLYNLREEIAKNGLTDEIFELALNQISDSDNECRWQAIIIIGEFLKSKQAEIWKVIMTYGSSTDDDMRMAIACILLEHYFEENIDLFENKISEMTFEISNGNKNLKKTLSYCNFSFDDKKHIEQIDKLLEK